MDSFSTHTNAHTRTHTQYPPSPDPNIHMAPRAPEYRLWSQNSACGLQHSASELQSSASGQRLWASDQRLWAPFRAPLRYRGGLEQPFRAPLRIGAGSSGHFERPAAASLGKTVQKKRKSVACAFHLADSLIGNPCKQIEIGRICASPGCFPNKQTVHKNRNRSHVLFTWLLPAFLIGSPRKKTEIVCLGS